MNARSRELIASINGNQVGVLRAENNVWSFTYAEAWVEAESGFDLAPNLPRASGAILDGATERPVQWFFDNLLPEESAREVLAREARVDQADAFGLLGYYGKESAGAITLLNPGEELPDAGYRELPDDELHALIAQLPRHSLAAGAPKRMSNAGAQHKLAVCVRDGKLFHPVGNTPSTHLLKPDHVDTNHYPNSVANEYFVMRLAERMRLNVPAVQIRYVPAPVYLIERFDRRITDAATERLHIIDACQLVGLDRSYKYRQSSVETLMRCLELCENRARSRLSMLEWVLFNLLVGNGDAHLKNLSFRVSSRGIELAPFYDLVSTESYSTQQGHQPRWPGIELTMAIGAAQKFGDVTAEQFYAFAARLGVNQRAASRRLRTFCERIEREAEALIQEFEASQIPEPAMRASQLRTLNTIRFVVIRDMVRRLGPNA